MQQNGHDEPAVLDGGQLIGLRDAGFTDLISVIAGGGDALDRVRRHVHAPRSVAPIAFDDAKLRAPIPRPPKVICIGLNYRDHAAEAKMAIPDVPTVFSKYATSITGHRCPIVLPRNSVKPDYEAELAVVIGKGGRHIPEDRWREHACGYTI